jgi:hypothetical protein
LSLDVGNENGKTVESPEEGLLSMAPPPDEEETVNGGTVVEPCLFLIVASSVLYFVSVD